MLKTIMNIFKVLGVAFIFTLFTCNIAVAQDNFTVKDLFPKASEMPSGSSAWIVSGITAEERDRCRLYTNTYTYYSKKGSSLLGIQRNNTYMVSVRIFACENFISAIDTYNSLTAVEEKIKREKKIAPVAFGERGVLLAMPVKENSQMADFYLTFLQRIFVVQVYSDDGFAQMDMAGEIEKRLNIYTAQQGVSYFLNKINIKTTHENLEENNTTVTFTGDNISSVVISGIVYDGNNAPVDGAELTVRETGQKTTTDSNGKYSLEITSGKGKSVSLKKIIFMDGVVYGEPEIISSGVYPLTISGAKSANNQVINILVTDKKIIGSSYIQGKPEPYSLTGNIDNNSITFIQNCTPDNSTFRCQRIFNGTVLKKGELSGKWKGTGGSGNWSINKTKYTTVEETPYLRDAGISLSPAKLSKGVLSGSTGQQFTVDTKKDKSFLRLVVSAGFSRDVFFKKGAINLEIINNTLEGDADLILYGLARDELGTTVKKIKTLATLNKDQSSSIVLDISSQLRLPDIGGYLIGIESKSKGEVTFIAAPNATLSYYADTDNYQPVETVSGKLVTFSGDDIVSNANNIKPDGENDIVLNLAISASGRTLEYVEVIAESSSIRRWNTNPFDIYPTVAIFKDKALMNDDSGSINLELERDVENLTLNIYKGSLNKDNLKKLTVKVILDGKIYESDLKY